MIIVKVGDRKVRIAQSYSEITVSEFSKLWKVIMKFKPKDKDEVLTDDEIIDLALKERETTIELLSVLLGLTKDEARQVDIDQAEKVIETYNVMMGSESLDINPEANKKFFIHNNETYYFPNEGYEGMNFGEYCELQDIQKSYDKEIDKKFDYIPKQIALCCRKKDEAKGSYDIEARTKEFEDLKMNKVLAWTFFLTSRIKQFNNAIQISLKKAGIESTEKLDTLSKDTDGLTQSMNLPEKVSLTNQMERTQ